MTTINVVKFDATEKAPVFHKYPKRNAPQGAYIELDCKTGRLAADWNAEIGNAIPFSVHHGHDRRYSISSSMSATAINELLDELAPIAQRIIDGYDAKWDGNNNVAVLNEDAQAAETELIEAIGDEEDQPKIEVWDVQDWLFSNCSLSDHWDTQPIEQAVSELENSVSDNMAVDGDFAEALIEQAKSVFESKPEKLNTNHVDELLKRGEITENDAAEWREIGLSELLH
jgi:hypothetical protein